MPRPHHSTCLQPDLYAERVVYGASDPKRGYSVFAPKAMHPKTEVVCGVLEEECAQLMKDFFKRKR